MKKKSMIILLLAVVLQCLVFGTMQFHTHPGGDEVFSYTLSDTPYSYDFIDHTWKHLPQQNGWVDATVLKRSYTVDQADRFQYGNVYWHQRLDTHPIVYYSLIYTVSSIFTGHWQPYYGEFVNILAFAGIDILMILILQYMTGNAAGAAVPIFLMMLMTATGDLAVLQRMYAMLAFLALWYLWINIRVISEKKLTGRRMAEMTAVVLAGSLTHYYFYVYAAGVSLFTVMYLIREKRIYHLLQYLMSGVLGLSLSLIIFPWMIWHIVFNQMHLHTDVAPWNAGKMIRYFGFLNQILFNGRGIAALFVAVGLCILWLLLKRFGNNAGNIAGHGQDSVQNRNIMIVACGSAFLYSLVIFTLDETSWYYMTGIYMPWIIFISYCLIAVISAIIAQIRLRKNDIAVKNGESATQTGRGGVASVLLAIAVIVLTLGVQPIMKSVETKVTDYAAWKQFHDTAVSLSDNDCIYVEATQTNLLSGIWFELGEYDEIKKMSVEEYAEGTLSDQCLSGRKTASEELIVFAPETCNAPASEGSAQAVKVASYGGMVCWEIK